MSAQKNQAIQGALEHWITRHGDVVYDLSMEILLEEDRALKTTQLVFKKWSNHISEQISEEFERAWALKFAWETLKSETRGRNIRPVRKPGGLPTDPEERLLFDFESLPLFSRALLTLSQKHKIPLKELSITFHEPEESLALSERLAIKRIDSSKSTSSLFSKLPMHSMPVSLKEDPLHPPAQKQKKWRLVFQLNTWRKAPWYWKSLLETVSIALGVSLIVLYAPKLKRLGDSELSKKLQSYDQGWIPSETKDYSGNSPSSEWVEPQATAPETTEADPAFGEEIVDLSAKKEETLNNPTKPLKVGPNEIWRMNLRAEHPASLKSSVISLLHDAGVPSGTPGLQGFIAPGGIQFDLFVEQSVTLGIKEKLEELATQTASQAENPLVISSIGKEAFAWFRHRSKKPIPAGKTRVVIWLSQ